jgi:hypothetical protein
MPEYFNKLNPAEAERLSLLLEECGEVLQIIGKIQRHGYGSSNRSLLEKELGHIMHAIWRMSEAAVFGGSRCNTGNDRPDVGRNSRLRVSNA